MNLVITIGDIINVALISFGVGATVGVLGAVVVTNHLQKEKEKRAMKGNKKSLLVPPGHYLVSTGEVQEGDLLWDKVDGWERASGEVGSPVTSFWSVARKQVG